MGGTRTLFSTSDSQAEVNEAMGVAPPEFDGKPLPDQPSRQPEGQPINYQPPAQVTSDRREGADLTVVPPQAVVPQGRAVARIDELTRKNGDLEREKTQAAADRDAVLADNERLRQQLADVQRGGQPPGTPPPADGTKPPVTTAPPTLETTKDPDAEPTAKPEEKDFASWAEWHEAKSAWTIAEAGRVARVEAKKVHATAKAEEERGAVVQQQIAAFDASKNDARTRYADFDAKLSSPETQKLPVNSAMMTAIPLSPKAGDILYHLANNPDEARRIAAMDPMRTAMAIGALESRFQTTSASATAPVTPAGTVTAPVTRAPQPPMSVPSSPNLEMPTGPTSGYQKHRRERLAQQSREGAGV